MAFGEKNAIGEVRPTNPDHIGSANRKESVRNAYISVVEAFAPLLLSAGVTCKEVQHWTREAVILGAIGAERANGGPLNQSVIAMRLGLQRQVVAPYLDGEITKKRPVDPPTLQLNQILYDWCHDPEYCKGNKPKTLRVASPNPQEKTFSTLAKGSAPGVYAPSLLKELVRVGAVESLSNERVRLVKEGYEPARLRQDEVLEIGLRLRDLTTSLVHNLFHRRHKRVCRTVKGTAIGAGSLNNVREALDRLTGTFELAVTRILTSSRWAQKEGEPRAVVTWNCHSAEVIETEEDSDNGSGRDRHETS